jgi:hypothetical protein
MRRWDLAAATTMLVMMSAPSGCGTCDDLPAEARELKASWASCGAADTCVRIDVANDCTGVFACSFAVNASMQDEARSESQRIADESRQCESCTQAFCAAPGVPRCDLASGRCVL